MGLGSWLRETKKEVQLALAFQRAKKQWERDMEKGLDPKITAAKTGKAVGAFALFTGLGAIALEFLKPGVLESILEAAGVEGAYAALIVLALRGGATAYLNARKHANGPSAGPGAIGVLVLAMLVPVPAQAQDLSDLPAEISVSVPGEARPVVTDPVQSSNWYRISSGGTRYFTPGRGDTTELEGQLAAEISLPGKLTAEAFVRFQRTQGAEQSVAGLLEAKTFRSVVGSVLLRYDVAQWSGVRVELLAVAGVSWERDKGFDPADPHVWLIGGGARLSNKRGAFDLAIAHAGEVGGAGVSGKLVINQSESARYIATYVVPFSAERFRQNPGTFTTSVQLDVLKRSF